MEERKTQLEENFANFVVSLSLEIFYFMIHYYSFEFKFSNFATLNYIS